MTLNSFLLSNVLLGLFYGKSKYIKVFKLRLEKFESKVCCKLKLDKNDITIT